MHDYTVGKNKITFVIPIVNTDSADVKTSAAMQIQCVPVDSAGVLWMHMRSVSLLNGFQLEPIQRDMLRKCFS